MRDNQLLTFYGSGHTNDVSSPQFADIEQRWEAFIMKSENPIALVEGHFDQISNEETLDRTQSIISGGDIHDRQWIDSITTPAPKNYVTNLIARRSGDLRDEYILSQIEAYWRKGNSPFAVFGSSHAIRLEPALRRLGNESA